ncbi:transposase [Streptomyces kaempferi]
MIVDAQSVKGAETMSKATRGYDASKHINGRKRHLLVDQDGLLVDLLVTPTDVQDQGAARVLLTRLHAEHPEIVLVWADNGYGGEEFSTWAQTTLGITVKVVSRPKDAAPPDAYVHADMTIKEKALALTAPVTARLGRYQPTDKVFAFLDRL